MHKNQSPRIPLPKQWPQFVKSTVLRVISLAQFATAYTRGWAANSINARIRITAEKDRYKQQVALLTEQIRILQARMARLDSRRRPHYLPNERMVILELRAAHGWTREQTAEAFLVSRDAIKTWHNKIDEEGPNALVQIQQPVNRFPDFVRYLVQRLKMLCPEMGKVKMAKTLCRAGLHLSKTTIDRILKEKPVPPVSTVAMPDTDTSECIVNAKCPNDIWHIDLTAVPFRGGLWTPWLHYMLPQCWPFCWWVAVVIDHVSRRCMGFTIFRDKPNSKAVQEFLDRTIEKNATKPKYIINDKGKQFWCKAYKEWCEDSDITPRFGAVGQSGSIAVVERFIKTLKTTPPTSSWSQARCIL